MPLRDTLLALLVALVWGLNFVVMKVGVGELPPFLITGLRFLLAAVPAILIVPRPRTPPALLVAFALLYGVLKFWLLFTAMRLGLSAGLSAVALQVQAVFTVAFAGLLLGERMTLIQAGGIALAAAGLAVLGVERGGGAEALPLAMVVVAAVVWGISNIIAKRSGGTEPLSFIVWASATAAPVLLVLSALFEQDDWRRIAAEGVSWQAVGVVAYLAYPVTLVSLAIFNGLLHRHSAAKVAPIILLVPIIGALGGHLLLGERLTRGLLAGGALIVAGLALETVAGRWRTRA